MKLELRGAGVTKLELRNQEEVPPWEWRRRQGDLEIHVASGRLEFSGRLAGRCSRAPNAHVFPFDHVSKQGRFLR